jgi:hypothetical protein
MLPKWLDTRKATEVGNALAEDFAMRSEPAKQKKRKRGEGHDPQGLELQKLLQKFMQRVDLEACPLRLNVLQRAKLANTFKWRLLEKGFERKLADELTQALVMRLSGAAAVARGRRS